MACFTLSFFFTPASFTKAESVVGPAKEDWAAAKWTSERRLDGWTISVS